ncbi:septum formation initiator family protein [Tannockella kyphosi]|uniref:septum formation initiator family protein n=1 Tax=Tannockella kyphosi TaxID=2899121 RepID=UPI002011D518|nr:septum formation initiator family protein [Tannockella kyphosi]
MARNGNLKGLLYLVFSVMMIVTIISKAIPIFSLSAQKNELEVEKVELEEQETSLEEVIDLLYDEEYALRYARSNYVFTIDGQSVSIIPD